MEVRVSQSQAKEWLAELLKGTRENLKSWEAEKGRKKAERKLDIFLLRLSLINRKRQLTILQLKFVGTILCVYTPCLETTSVIFRNTLVIKINQTQHLLSVQEYLQYISNQVQVTVIFFLRFDFNFSKVSGWNTSLIIMICQE